MSFFPFFETNCAVTVGQVLTERTKAGDNPFNPRKKITIHYIKRNDVDGIWWAKYRETEDTGFFSEGKVSDIVAQYE